MDTFGAHVDCEIRLEAVSPVESPGTFRGSQRAWGWILRREGGRGLVPGQAWLVLSKIVASLEEISS